MTTYYYDAIRARGFKRGPCAVCGKSAERSREFYQTVNPWNRNPDGSIKTTAEIRREVNAEAKAWQDDAPVVHARCEGTEVSA